MSDTVKKVNKLASAVYLVTSFFSDQEPLKWKMRELSSHLLSSSLSFKSYLFEERDYAGLENRQTVLGIVALLSMAKNVGLLSDTNYTLLNQEFSKYLDSIGLPSGLEESDGQAVLSEKFFASPSRGTQINIPLSENLIKDKTMEEPIKKMGIKRELLGEPSPSRPLKQFGLVSVKKNSRQSVIINLLKRKKEIMIKDVSPLISGCSEKTIQRELLAMVASGVLKKIGEKRWSRYTLA